MADKDKPKINLKKRKFKTSPLSSLMPNLLKSIGGAAEARNAASIIRLMNHWPEIIGAELADKTTPLKMRSLYQKNRDTGEQEQIMVLKIMAESALGTIIAMRQTIILERVNRLFGGTRFKKLDIIQGQITKTITPKKENTDIHFDLNITDIDDPILKSRLESLGQAVMNSSPNKKD